jgi:hypothetical protein
MQCIGSAGLVPCVVDYDLPQDEVWNMEGDIRSSLEDNKHQRAEAESHEQDKWCVAQEAASMGASGNAGK